VNPDDEFLELCALLREARALIQRERDALHECEQIPSGPRKGSIPNAGARAELRKFDRWLKRAKKVLA
jgi:hypothetical protein